MAQGLGPRPLRLELILGDSLPREVGPFHVCIAPEAVVSIIRTSQDWFAIFAQANLTPRLIAHIKLHQPLTNQVHPRFVVRVSEWDEEEKGSKDLCFQRSLFGPVRCKLGAKVAHLRPG